MVLRLCYACEHCKIVPSDYDEDVDYELPVEYHTHYCYLFNNRVKHPFSVCCCDEYIRNGNIVDLTGLDQYLLEELEL